MATVKVSELSYDLPSVPDSFKPTGMWTVVFATIRKDLIKQFRYKSDFYGQFIRIGLFVAVFWFFGVAMSLESIPIGGITGVFLFFLSGMLLIMYDGTTLYGPYDQVKSDMYNGVLESIYVSPSSRYGYYLGGTIARALFASIYVIPFLFIIAIVGNVPVLNMGMVVVVILTALLTFTAMGIIVALTTILYKETASIVNILGLLFQFITGALIPFVSLPGPIQVIGLFFPITYAIDLIRFYTFDGVWVTFFPVWVNWVALFGIFILYTMTSRFLLRRVERMSKKKGLHLI